MKKIFRCLFVLLLLMSFTWAIADTNKTMTLPSSLKIIEEEAFSGIAVEKVVIPEGTTEIHSRAFANCSLAEVVLPASLTYIADDAFADSQVSKVDAPDETYAYDWADAQGFIWGAIKEVVIDLPSGTEIDITQSFQIPYYTVPRNSNDKLRWVSLNPEIATVDDNGLVTPVKAGHFSIIVECNGDPIRLFSMWVTGDFYHSDGLEYTLTADGAGYQVSGCTGDPGRITIPAMHDGLPVVGFVPGAFKECSQLTDIALEEGHTVLYIENSSLYANLPQKTLLYHPAAHLKHRHYYVSEGTQAIAAYAFAQSWLFELTIPEGVVSIGDCTFYKLHRQLSVFVPDSLTDFGSHLFQSQQQNGVFYVKSWSSPAVEYAQKNQIPCGVVNLRTPEPTMIPTPTPAPTPTPDIPALDESNVVVYNELQGVAYQYCDIKCLYDISDLEGDDVTEVRLAIKDQWKEMTYYPELTQQTGLYGAGYTGQKAILRAYDQYGRQIGAKEIEGNFIFSFDGACSLGVSNGKNTSLMVVPTKPIVITSPGRYPVQPSQWHSFFDGDIYQHYILAMPRGMTNFTFPDYLNILAHTTVSCTTNEENSTKADYKFCTLFTRDGSRAQQIYQFTMIFDSLECLINNDKLGIYAASLPQKSDNLGESISKVFDATWSEMMSVHSPATLPVKKVQVFIDGTYPFTYLGNINLDNAFFEYDEYDVRTLSHEFVHAIDQRMQRPNGFDSIPSAWMEGRAEYISKVLCAKWGVPYTSYTYDGDFDWSFLSAVDRADFFQYYYHSTNRYTTYSVGYYFYDFLIDTYGSNVGAKIMNNIVTLPYDYDTSDKADFFKQCVEAATEVGVFQRFVNDVVIPSGT